MSSILNQLKKKTTHQPHPSNMIDLGEKSREELKQKTLKIIEDYDSTLLKTFDVKLQVNKKTLFIYNLITYGIYSILFSIIFHLQVISSGISVNHSMIPIYFFFYMFSVIASIMSLSSNMHYDPSKLVFYRFFKFLQKRIFPNECKTIMEYESACELKKKTVSKLIKNLNSINEQEDKSITSRHELIHIKEMNG